MPSPLTLRAPAVWITARTWSLAAEACFGASSIRTPDGRYSPNAALGLIDSLLDNTPSQSGRPSRVLAEARTFGKDVRVARLHASGSRLSGAGSEASALEPALVWQHHDPFFRLGERLARSHDAPLLQFVDAPHVWEGRRWGVRRPGWASLLQQLGEAIPLRQADAIACVSEEVADAVYRIAKPRCPIAVTPCTPDRTFFNVGTERERWRRSLDLTPEDVAIGWAGSFRRFHAVEDLIHAFELSAEALPQARLVLFGNGSDRRRLEAIASASRHAERIHFAGQIAYSQMPDAVSALDIAVLTARSSQDFHYSPLKLREYRAAGRAIIAPYAGQVASTVVDGEDGLLYEPGDVSSLTHAIQRIATDQELQRRLGRAAAAAESRTGGASAQLRHVLSLIDAHPSKPATGS